MAREPKKTLAEIVREVCAKHGVAVEDVVSRRRCGRPVWFARHEAYWRARTETNSSYPEIARAFGKHHHTTIMFGVAAYEERNSLPRTVLPTNKQLAAKRDSRRSPTSSFSTRAISLGPACVE